MIGYTVVECPYRTMSAVFRCGRCKETKPASDFRLPSPGKYCRPCEKQYKLEWYEKNKSRVIAKTAAWRLANPDRYKRQNQTYYRATYELRKPKIKEYALKNRERENKRKTEWRRANLEKQRQVEALYREQNRADCNERSSKWKSLNPDKLRIYTAARGRAIKQAIPKWADKLAIRAICEQAEAMRSAGLDVHIDHIVPLVSALVCGLHVENNLQIIPSAENAAKSNKRWPDMP